VIVTLVLILVAVIGPHLIPNATPRYVAHLVQTNFPQSESYPPDWLQVHAPELDQLEQISVDAAHQIPGIIIWPEVPAPFSFNEQPFAARALRIAQNSGNYFLVGVVDWKRNPEGKWLASNSAVLLNPQGQRTFGYDKIHLLPFGEYVPLRGWLTFAKRLTADISDFTPGSTYGVAQLPQALSQQAQGGAFSRPGIADGQGEAAFSDLLFDAPAEAFQRRSHPEGRGGDLRREGVELQTVEREELFIHEGLLLAGSVVGVTSSLGR